MADTGNEREKIGIFENEGFIDVKIFPGLSRTLINSIQEEYVCMFGVRRVSRRFEIFRSAARPRAALIYFGLRHVSCRFKITTRPVLLECGESLAALEYFGLRRVPAPL